MNIAALQPGGLGQTLALVCFGVAILALLWVYRRGQSQALRRRRAAGLPGALDEYHSRVEGAHTQIARIEEEQRYSRLSSAMAIGKRQDELSSEQDDVLERIGQHQDKRKASGEAQR